MHSSPSSSPSSPFSSPSSPFSSPSSLFSSTFDSSGYGSLTQSPSSSSSLQSSPETSFLGFSKEPKRNRCTSSANSEKEEVIRNVEKVDLEASISINKTDEGGKQVECKENENDSSSQEKPCSESSKSPTDISSSALRSSVMSPTSSTKVAATQPSQFGDETSHLLFKKRVAFSSPIVSSEYHSFRGDGRTSYSSTSTNNKEVIPNPTRSILKPSFMLPTASSSPKSSAPNVPSQFRVYRPPADDERSLEKTERSLARVGSRKREASPMKPNRKSKVPKIDLQPLSSNEDTLKSSGQTSSSSARGWRTLDLSTSSQPSSTAPAAEAPPERAGARARRLNTDPIPAEKWTFPTIGSGCTLS